MEFYVNGQMVGTVSAFDGGMVIQLNDGVDGERTTELLKRGVPYCFGPANPDS